METICSFWVSTTQHYVVLDEDNNLVFITTDEKEAIRKQQELNVAYANDDPYMEVRFYVYKLADGLYLNDIPRSLKKRNEDK